MKTLKRGRGNKATPKEKKVAMQWQHERVKIANLIARKPEIQKICCICGKEGKILHNRKNPYYITFICDECKKDPKNINKAEKTRFDVREKLDKANLCVHNFRGKQIKDITENYLKNNLSIGDYCQSIGISRHQFKQVMYRYNEIYSKKNICVENKIKKHSNAVQSEKMKTLCNLQSKRTKRNSWKEKIYEISRRWIINIRKLG